MGEGIRNKADRAFGDAPVQKMPANMWAFTKNSHLEDENVVDETYFTPYPFSQGMHAFTQIGRKPPYLFSFNL